MSDSSDGHRDAADRMGGFQANVGGRVVVVKIGAASQTVSICTAENRPGTYERRYRLPSASPLRHSEVKAITDLDALTRFVTERGGGPESVDTSRRALPDLIHRTAISDQWLAEAVAIVEVEIDHLVRDFLAEPFLHRVEHSVHADFFSRLARHAVLAETHPIGNIDRRTQLVHKEWPETSVDTASSSRRGAFDLVVLAPQQLAAATLDHVRYGRIAAPIVIEFGLNYPLKHLEQDYRKLETSKIELATLFTSPATSRAVSSPRRSCCATTTASTPRSPTPMPARAGPRPTSC